MSFPDPIKRLTKGSTPTLLETSKGNEVIDSINAIANMTIQKGDKDHIEKTSTGIDIFYKGGVTDGTTTTIFVIDGGDISKGWNLTFDEGVLVEAERVNSNYKTRRIAICSNGSTEFIDFVIKE
jgi:hypothetical protein